MQLSDAIKKRHSVRRFLNKTPDWRDIIECIDAMRYAPMAGNDFSLKIIMVDEPKKIYEIGEACQQDFVKQAKYIVVVCSNKSILVNSYGMEKGEMFARQQAGSAIENFLLEIEQHGLATCWIGYFIDDIIKRILDIPDDIDVEAVFPIGYAFDKNPKLRQKINLDACLYFNKWKNKKMVPPKRLEI